MISEGEGNTGSSREEAWVVVGSTLFGVLDQVRTALVCSRQDLKSAVLGEIRIRV